MRFFVMLTIVFLLTLFVGQARAEFDVSANNAILIDKQTGEILYDKKANERQSIASITKVMTAILAIESGNMNQNTRASRRAISTEGSSIYLEQGERMSMDDLVYGLMLRSGNDAAVALGEHIGGSLEGFVYLMNEKAQWLGMTNTNFANPHGLESDDHYSTAYDMALLMQYALDNNYFKKISGTTSHKAKTRSYAWGNKNKLLTSLYPYCTGGKTGFTKKAGRTLLTSAQQNNNHLIAVTLNAPNDWNDHIIMYEWGFTHLNDSLMNEAISNLHEHPSNKNILLDISLIFKRITGINSNG